ncbi:lamin tail domain-containing protein [Nocardioides sp. W7]|uniref:lamin tail domain-containing protein n=1 Tax=Nocardioides sp. W7 TaxID=2931390 RepID=UPI001FD2525C|nr:lamin tail domain-containing protein [Nocardioides sp. W7]
MSLVAVALTLLGLTVTASTAQAADEVVVPDANFKAVLNAAIATATSTSRTPDQDITPADALTVTAIDTGYVDDAPIATLTGLEAFTNVTTLAITRAGSTATDLRPIGSLRGLTSLQTSLPVTSLDGLESVTNLNILQIASAQLTDVSALLQLTQLTNVTIQEAARLKDISAVAASKGTIVRLTLQDTAVEDINFLEGFKNVGNLVLPRNRIEDVSVFGRFDDSYKLNDTKSNRLTLSGNRIRDFSPVVAFRNLKGFNFGPTAAASGQSIYVGPYDAVNGVTVPLKSGPHILNNPPATPVITPAGTGTYDPATGMLTSADPAATFVTVSPNWTINFSEAPDKLAALRVNEVESNGDAVNGDWVELYNPGSSALDLGGLVVADNDDTHKITVPAGTKIPAMSYRAIRTDDPAVAGQFGLGGGDSVRVFAPGTTDLTTAPIDSYSWTAHATTTYGRTVPGAGFWATTSVGTFGAVNEFPPPTAIPTVATTGDATSINGSAKLTATVTKPDSTEVATDATGTVVFAVGGTDVSGPVTVTGGKAEWTATGLAGSPSGTAHQVTARYVSSGESDPYDDSVASAQFTVTVTILEFAGAPTLSTATPGYCDTVTSSVAGITQAPEQVGYQWQMFNGNGYGNIAGATSASHPMYTVNGTTVDVASRPYRLQVTAVRAGYVTKTWTLETTAVASDVWSAESKKAAVLSTSTPKVGETITATHQGWDTCFPAALNYEPGYAYQWLRDGQPITGATDEVAGGVGGAGPKQVSYAVTPADAGRKISLQVRGIRPAVQFEGSTTESTATAAVAAGAFTNSPVPAVDNVSPKVGDKLTASTAAWSPVAAFAYQWLRDGAPITGATSASYTTTAADADHALSVKATGTAEGYATTEKTSAATAKVARLVFAGTSVPVIGGGTPTVGDTLTATVAPWAPVASFTWQWLRDGQPIAGATAASYPVTAADQGRALSVRVTGAAAGYEPRSVTSQSTAAVAAKAPAQVADAVRSSYVVKIKALKGKKLQVIITAQGVPASRLDSKATLKLAGVKGSYRVTLKNGRATIATGRKAKLLKKGAKVKATLALPGLVFATTTATPATVTTTTYTVAKVTKKVTVKLK